ncbi:MAG: zf-HC2 domain-containing protein [Nitrospina sp.]|nr:zf-HC2 domain-containing protein [Nitrospina sp.]
MSGFDKQLNCDEARHMINENLDQGTKPADLINLSHHLKGCHSCDEFLSNMSGFENGLEELRKVYDQLEPDEKLKQTTLNKIAELAHDSKIRHGRKAIFNGWSGMTIRTHMMAGLSGTFAGVLLWFAIFGLGLNAPKEASRFLLHPVEFHTVEDKMEWNHHDMIPPGHTLRKTVKQGSENSFHFRLKSDGPVDLVVRHETPKDHADHRFSLSGVRYASLHVPQKKDVIVIRNEGDHPVELKAYTQQDKSFDSQSAPNEIKS